MLTLAFAGAGAALPDISASRQVQAWSDSDGGITARAYVGIADGWIDAPLYGIFRFASGSRTVCVWPAAGASKAAIRGQFERVLQPLILQALGWQTLHAAAVMGSAGVLAFCGLGGAGKSTTTYALRHLGW